MTGTRKKPSKLMELVLYIASKSNQQATFSELENEFVVRRGWSRSTLTKYLSLLHEEGVISRSWLKYVVAGEEKRFRVYRINADYFRQR